MGVCTKNEHGATPIYVAFLLVVVFFLYSVYISVNILPLWEEMNSKSGEERLSTKKVVYTEIVLFHTFFAMFLISFARACTTHPQKPGVHWKDANFARKHSRERKRDGSLRFCSEKGCRSYKPDRAHHCRKLGHCVNRMDHYCPWLNNTLGFNNVKYFFLTLFYGMCTLLCFVIFMFFRFVHACKAIVNVKTDFLVVFSWFMALLLYILITWFFFFHCRLAANAYTTIEHCEKKRAADEKVQGTGRQVKTLYQASPFDTGLMNNICEILGPYPPLWIIPTYCGMRTDGDLYYDPTGKCHYCNADHPLFNDGSSKRRVATSTYTKFC